MDRKLDFVIAGAQKGGTTSLHDYLREHPQLFLPREKDFVVFMDGHPSNIPENELGSFFRSAKADQFLGLSYVDLLFFPECPERLHQYNPELKIIVALRDPVERAYSNFSFNVAYGREIAASFEEALELEAERMQGSWRDRATRTYLSHGKYAEQLERFLQYFSPSQLHVLLSEELRRDPEEVLGAVFRFLGVDESFTFDFSERRNVSSAPRWRFLQRLMWSPPSFLLTVFQGLPLPVRRLIRYRVVEAVNRANLSPRVRPEMDPDLRRRLGEYFAPHNRRLEELTGLDLGEWS